MPNIAGISGTVAPGVYSRVRSIRRTVSIPGGLRVVAILGLGQAEETVVLEASGNGADGVNSNYIGSNAPDGRHFILSKFPLVSNRTSLTLNGIPLRGLEGTITAAFDKKYDFMVDRLTGQIALQSAFLAEQGGSYAPSDKSNVGNGTITGLSLVDTNAPTETWSIRASSVIRDAFGNPVDGYSTFTVTGSVSGQPLDAYGNPVKWQSNGVSVSNGILRFQVVEGGTPFNIGDRFTIKTESRVLAKGDTLEANYIAEANIDAPQFFVDANALYQQYGFPSTSNTLSLGSQLAFENGAFGVLALQTAPAMPRRTSEVVLPVNDPLSSNTGGFPVINNPITYLDNDAFEYPIELGTPDTDTEVHMFVVNAATGLQGDNILYSGSKVPFYSITYSSQSQIFNDFINPATSGYHYNYTVIETPAVEQLGTDGYITSKTFIALSGTFGTDPSQDLVDFYEVSFDGYDALGNDIAVTNPGIVGSWDIAVVGDGYGATDVLTLESGFNVDGYTLSNLRWRLVNTAKTAPELVLTDDWYTGGHLKRGDGVTITFIDQKDASFYDANWASAFEALETVDCQIVVPLPDATVSNIQQAAVAHCELMSNTVNQRERVTFIGAQQGLSPANVLGTSTVSLEQLAVLEGIIGYSAEDVLGMDATDLVNYSVTSAFGETFRAMYFWPDQVNVNINGAQTVVDGFYQAAAAAGWCAGMPNVSVPLTRKVLVGYSINSSKLLRPIILNQMLGNGITVVQPVVGGGLIIQGITTTASGDPLEQEPSVVFVRDATAQSLRVTCRGFIGQPQDATLIASITSAVIKTLQALVAQGLISNFGSVSVARDGTEPRQINVSCLVFPVLPLDWIFVDIGVSIA